MTGRFRCVSGVIAHAEWQFVGKAQRVQRGSIFSRLRAALSEPGRPLALSA